MKGFTAKLVSVLALAGTSLLGGCVGYNNLVDTCYPERYEAMARREVYEPFATQSKNGHVLDQTIWNYEFERDGARNVGTDKLTPGALDKLATLARRRAAPDTVIFLQTANDIPYDPAQADAFPQARAELDRARIASVQKYLAAQTSGRPTTFEVVVHDPAIVDLSGEEVRNTIVLPQNVQPKGIYLNSFGTTRVQTGGSQNQGAGGVVFGAGR